MHAHPPLPAPVPVVHSQSVVSADDAGAEPGTGSSTVCSPPAEVVDAVGVAGVAAEAEPELDPEAAP